MIRNKQVLAAIPFVVFIAGCAAIQTVQSKGAQGLAAAIRAECALSPKLRATNYYALIGAYGHPVIRPLDCDGDGQPDFGVEG